MPKLELDARATIQRLRSDGWVSEGGAKHEKFRHPERPGEIIMVPRHRTLSPGVARSIARAAGWL
jgi:predicted RNA binding protein YcfA (HicA-like mRNA interferase family)